MRLLAAIVALATTVAAQAAPIGYEGARHLLDRTGFGATDREVREFAALDRAQAVDRLLEGARRAAVTPPPQFVNAAFEPYARVKDMDPEDRKVYVRKLAQQGLELRAWWIGEMLATPSPLTERMTLFWHNHFATSQRKVRLAQLMYRQNVLLRREALGNFGTLLHAIAKDPAMLVWLDNAGSRRQAPNENFAREVMELFTLGVGSYGERDVKEAARAFTGFSLDRQSGEYRYRPFFHDDGAKTVLGRMAFDGDEVLDILLARPETARFVASKVWREFVSPTPDAVVVERWAAVFRGARYEIKPLMRAVLMSDAFWNPANRATLVKSPVDIVVGTLRTFDIHPVDLRPAAVQVAVLGQNLFAPPNVKGWPGGDAWIDSATLLGRKQFVERVFRGSDAMSAIAQPEEMMARGDGPIGAGQGPGTNGSMQRMMDRGLGSYAFNPQRWMHSLEEGGTARDVEHLVLATAPVNPVPADADAVARVRALVADPAYQLR